MNRREFTGGLAAAAQQVLADSATAERSTLSVAMTRREMSGWLVFKYSFKKSAALLFSGGVTDEHDLIRGSEIFRNLLIE